MGIKFNSKNKSFELSTNNVLYVFRVTKSGYLRHVYFGEKTNDYKELEIVNNHDPYVDQDIEERFSLSGLPNEYPAFGLGDYREIAVKYTLKDGTRNNNLKYKKHVILNKKSKIESLPSLEGDNELIVTLTDKDIDVELHYSVYEKENVITRRTVILNHGDEVIINTIHFDHYKLEVSINQTLVHLIYLVNTV